MENIGPSPLDALPIGLSKGSMVNPDMVTQRRLGTSMFDGISNKNARSSLQNMISGLKQSGASVQMSKHTITARLGGDVLNIPVFRNGQMFHKGSVYNTVGGIGFHTTAGGVSNVSLQEHIYDQANKALIGGKNPQAKFSGIQNTVDSMFKQVSATIDGQHKRMSAGEAAGLFDIAYESDLNVRQAIAMRDRRVIFAEAGTDVFTKLAAESAAMQQMTGASARRTMLSDSRTHFNIIGPRDSRGNKVTMLGANEKWAISRKRAINSVLALDDRFNFFAGSQSGNFLFNQPSEGSSYPMLGMGNKKYMSAGVSLAKANQHQISPGGSELNKGIHQMIGQSYMPLPSIVKGKGLSSSANQKMPLITTLGYAGDMARAKKITGNMGTFVTPMDVGVIVDPNIRRAVHSKSGAMAVGNWGVHGMSTPATYRRRVKIAMTGLDVAGEDIAKFVLDDNIKKHMSETLARTGQLEYGGSILGETFESGQGIKLSSGSIGAHLNMDGEYAQNSAIESLVRPNNAEHDRVIGYKLKRSSGEIEFTMRGQRQFKLGRPVLIEGQRVILDKTTNLQLQGAGGKSLGVDILADIDPINTNLQLQTIAQRTRSRFGKSGLKMLAKSMGAEYKTVFGQFPTIEGGMSSSKDYGEVMRDFSTAIESFMAKKGGSKSAAAQAFQQLTNLEVARLDPKTSLSMLQRDGNIKIGSKLYEQIAKEGIQVFRHRGAGITQRSKQYAMKSGSGSVKFKFDDVRLLGEILPGLATSSGDTKAFAELTKITHQALESSNPEIFKDIASMSRAYIRPGSGLGERAIGSFKPLPAGLSDMTEIPVEKLKGTILVDENGKLRNRGFNVKLANKTQIGGSGMHWLPTQSSDLFYFPSASTAGFSIDEKSGSVRLNGGPKSAVGGTQLKRAWLELWESAQSAGGFDKLSVEGIRGRLEAVQGTLMETALSKQGTIRNASIKSVVGGQGRQGYMPELGADEIGMTPNRIKSVFGDKLYKEYVRGALDKNEDVFLMSRRHPQKSGMQLRAQRVVEIPEGHMHAGMGPDAIHDVKLDADDMFYTSRTMQYMSQGDLDGDTIEAFLMSDDTKHWSSQQKAVGRMYAAQQRQTKRVEGIYSEMNSIAQYGDLSDIATRKRLATETMKLNSAKGAGALSGALSGEHLFDVTQPKALAPLAETFFRTRSQVAREMSKLTTGAINEIEAIGSLQRWAKEEISGETLELARKLISADTALLHGEQRSIISYASLTKSANSSAGMAEVSMGLMDSLGQYGKILAANPGQLDDPSSDMVGDIAKQLSILYESDKIADGGLPKSQYASYLINDENARSPELMNNALRKRAKSLLGVEAFMARAGIESPYDMLTGFKDSAVNKVASRGSTYGLETAHLMGEYFGGDEAFRKSEFLDQLPEDVKARASEYAQSRMNKSNSAYDAAINDTMGSGGIGGRAKGAADAGRSAISKLTRSKFFKPAAVALGALSGWEVLKSVINGPGETPAPMSYTPSAPLPPAPILDTPDHASFSANSLPQNNIGRIQRVEGQRTHSRVSGSVGDSMDFRGITSAVVGSYGVQPVQSGVFRDDRSNPSSRRDMDRFIQQRMTAAY